MSGPYTLEIYPMTVEAAARYSNIEARTNENAGVDIYTVNVDHRSNIHMVHSQIVAKLLNTNGEPVHFYLAPRSSIWKSGVVMANSMGIIDSSYRGELMGACLHIPGAELKMNVGERLFQILAPDMGHISGVIVRQYEELDTTSRGAGGFGSTG